MKMERDLQHRLQVGRNAIEKLLFISIILLLASCNVKNKSGGPVININVIGSYIPNERFKVVIEQAVLFDKVVKSNELQDRRLVYYPKNFDSVKIIFSVNNRDTSFIYHLRKKNFLIFGKSLAYKQLLVSKVDSVEYWKNLHDYVQ
jgi:hypothetical protein